MLEVSRGERDEMMSFEICSLDRGFGVDRGFYEKLRNGRASRLTGMPHTVSLTTVEAMAG